MDLFIVLLIQLQLYTWFTNILSNLDYNCYGSLIGRLLLTDLREKKHELICQTADAGFNF